MNIVEYMRVGRVRAIVYVNGQDEGIQELMCKLYANDKQYDVVGVIKNLGKVKDCDILLVSHSHKISRDYIKYLQVASNLRDKGIKIETALSAAKDKENKLKNMGVAEILKSL